MSQSAKPIPDGMRSLTPQVLGRPLWHPGGPIWTPVVGGHAQAGPDAAADPGGAREDGSLRSSANHAAAQGGVGSRLRAFTNQVLDGAQTPLSLT